MRKGCSSSQLCSKIAQIRPSEEIEKALGDWIALNFTKRIREEAPIIPEKVRGGESCWRITSNRRV